MNFFHLLLCACAAFSATASAKCWGEKKSQHNLKSLEEVQKSLGIIHTYPNNPKVYKALVAAKYVGLQIDLNKDFKFKVDNIKPDFLAKFPVGKVPVFEGNEGNLFESNAIAYYVAALKESSGLLGKTAMEKAEVIQYMHFLSNEFSRPAFEWLIPLLGYIPFDAESVEKAREAMKVPMGQFNQMLSNKTFLVGKSITLADIVCACDLYWLMQYVMDAEYRAPFPNVVRWFETVVNQENFKAVAGKFEFCSKALTEPKKAE